MNDELCVIALYNKGRSAVMWLHPLAYAENGPLGGKLKEETFHNWYGYFISEMKDAVHRKQAAYHCEYPHKQERFVHFRKTLCPLCVCVRVFCVCVCVCVCTFCMDEVAA